MGLNYLELTKVVNNVQPNLSAEATDWYRLWLCNCCSICFRSAHVILE